MQKKGKKEILRGAVWLGLGAFLSKVLGAFYRVPLTNLIGGYGLGLYQTVFPVYALLLDFSGAGVPSAVSGLIASSEDKERRAHEYFNTSIRLLLIFGAIASILTFAFSKPLSFMQGNPAVYLAYRSLSPAILAVSIICAFRGYFQGLMDMKPTAISQVVEQAVKLIFGLALAKLFLPNIPKAVAGATFAITLSEFFALLILYVIYRKRRKIFPLTLAFNNENFRARSKEIIKATIPITLISVAIPLSHVIDSFLIVNVLGAYRSDATVLYGLLSGVCLTVINLPVSVCYGISTVTIPAVSRLKDEESVRKNSRRTLLLTLIISLPCALFCLIFAPFIINFLFRSLSLQEKTIAINLLRLTSPCVILLSMLQTENAVLIGKKERYKPLFSLIIGVLIKTMLNFILLNNPKINIYGGGVSLIACYFTACLINLIMIFKLKVKNGSSRACRREYAS